MIKRRRFILILCGLIGGCLPRSQVLPEGTPPALLVGQFEDDYGIRYTISARAWIQQPGSTYHVAEWHPEARYLIARNDDANPSDGGLWTRIDWMELPDMAPYTWAFCLSAYAASTPAEADATRIADRDQPRTGCNGHPFSRMRRLDAEGP